MHFRKRHLFFFAAAVIFCSANVLAQDTTSPWKENTIDWLSRFSAPVTVEDADAAAEDNMKEYTEAITNTGVTFGMVPIPGGKFLMGSTADEQEKFGVDDDEYMGIYNASEGPQHEVEVAPFWMGKCVVTWGEYKAWCAFLEKTARESAGTDPSEHDLVADAMIRPTPPYTDMTFDMGEEGRPAIAMSLYAAQMYCKWLTAKTGRYYRLPTEAEWEYACRAGTDTAYSFGDDSDDFKDYGWNYDNSNDKYQKVGLKKANPWGLYDMHGNVREWVLDGFALDGYQQLVDEADGKTLVNPFLPKQPAKVFTTESGRYPGVARGGSWYDDVENCRSASRFASNPEWNNADPQIPKSIWFESSQKWIGFRVVRPLTPPSAEEAAKFEPNPETAMEYGRLNPRQNVN